MLGLSYDVLTKEENKECSDGWQIPGLEIGATSWATTEEQSTREKQMVH